MRASTKRALSLLVASSFIIGALIMYVTFIRPEYDTVSKLQEELNLKLQILDETKGGISGVANLKLDYGKNEKKIETLSLALPFEEDISSIMSQINNRAEAYGLVVQSVGINYLPLKTSAATLSFTKGIGTLQLDLKLFGPYFDFKRFLQDLERNVRIMDIKSLRMESVGRPGQDLYGFTLTVDAYYQPK